MINWIIGFAILIAIYFALRSVVKSVKNGGCMGCSSCEYCGCSCGHEKENK